MTQVVFPDIDPATKTGTALADDLNDFKEALLTSHSGTSAPTYIQTGTLWYQTNDQIFSVYDGTDNIPIWMLDTTNNVAKVAVDADKDSYIVADTDDEIDVVLATSVTYTFKAAGVVAPGIYLGGTGSANLLTDYETGTFSPSIVLSGGGLTGTFTAYFGKYTKIGDTVFVDIEIVGSGMTWPTSGAFLTLSSLPFTPAAGSGNTPLDVIGSGVFAASPSNGVFGSVAILETGNMSFTNASANGTASSINASFSYKV